MSTKMEVALAHLLDGRISFKTFAKSTTTEIERMAKYLTRRWKPPSFMTTDDVMQELLIGVHRCLWDYYAGFGKTLVQYVTFNAMSYAKREIYRAQGAILSGTACKNPSHVDVPFSALSSDEDKAVHMVERLTAVPAEAEVALLRTEERLQRVREFAKFCKNPEEMKVFKELGIACAVDVEPDVDLVARFLAGPVDDRARAKVRREAAKVIAEVYARAS